MDYCAHCSGGLLGNVIEFHPNCAERIITLWSVVKKFADEKGERGFGWDADELWPLIKPLLYGESTERIIKVKVETDGNVTYGDITDEYNSLWQTLRNTVNQTNEVEDESNNSE